jgi:hypothetical protein
VKDARPLVRALIDPASTQSLDPPGWTSLITIARAESLIGTLAFRLEGAPVPDVVADILADARRSAMQAQVHALWEAEMARRALAALDVPLLLLKGTAYAEAGLDAAIGRSIGDLDILVPRDALDQVEAALLVAGWEWVKEDPYDHLYYRRWMHELPPMIHRARDRMIDVHHTILPPTARPTPNAQALIDSSVALSSGMRMLAPSDMIVHSATHLFADGDLAGGLRNLWDIDRLVRQFTISAKFWFDLAQRSDLHELRPAVARALRLAQAIYGTPVDPALAGRWQVADRLFRRRLLARDGWGRQRDRGLRFGFYVRSHWLRMPPALLARHLWTKARKGG